MKITRGVITKVAMLSIFLTLVALIKGFGLSEYVSLAWMQDHLTELHAYINTHYALSVCIFLVSYIIISTLGIPGSTLFITASGLLFGAIGGVYALIGATGGAMALFFASRYVLGNWVQRKYQHKLATFNKAFEERGMYYLLAIRALALLPFGMINALSGITLVRPFLFFITTVIGIIPYICIYTFAGIQLGAMSAHQGWFTAPVMAFIGTMGLRMLILPFAIHHVFTIRREYRV